MGKKQEKIENLVGAALLMEELFLSKTYPANKRAEKNMKLLSKKIKTCFSEYEMRREYSDHEVIAKFQRVNVYETDWKGLSEYLSDYGILHHVARIPKELEKTNPDTYSQLQSFQLPVTHYVRFSPRRYSVDLLDVDKMPEIEMVKWWRLMKRDFTSTEKVIDKAKQQMLYCPYLIEKKSMKCNFGSVSLLNNDPVYNMSAILEEFGPDFLIEHAQIDSKKLNGFIEKGFITPKAVNQFKKVIDIQLRFMILDAETEAKQMEMLKQKIFRASKNRQVG